ncbi:MAG: tetratricopeptide repeat protein [Myxococcaceae bacterium]
MSSFSRVLACSLTALLVLSPGLARAQVDLVDPDAPQPKAKKKKAPVDETTDTGDDPVTDVGEGDGTLVAPPTVKKNGAKDAGVGNPKDPKGAPTTAVKPPEPVAPPKKDAPPVVVKAIGDADLNAAWKRWADANASKKPEAEAEARKQLLELKNLIGSPNAELWAVGMLRAAQVWEANGDSGAAVEIAVSAADLAPDLPATWFLLTRLYAQSDPSGIGRYLGSLQKGLSAQFADPRYARPMVADLATVLLLALVLTAIVVLVVLMARRGYYFLYDFHFLFPRAAARWQTGALAVMLLILPIVFRMGVVPTLLLFFATLTMYLSMSERVVAAVLIGLLGLVPLAGAFVVERTAFAETAAEDLYLVERGGPGVEPIVQRLEKLAAEDKVGFAERFVLGHFHLRRGHVEQALPHLKQALTLRPEDVPSQVALAKAFFLQGDLENSRALLDKVKGQVSSPVVLMNLSRIYRRRAQVYGTSNAGEVGKANEFQSQARELDGTLPAIGADDDAPKEIIGNSWLRTLPLAQADVLELAKGDEAAKRVRSQLSQMLVGDVPASIAPFYPAVLAALLVAFGLLGTTLQAAKVCARCGRAVSKRGDPDVPAGSGMCTQCVNVFAKKNVVAPSVKVRKQLEVARYESRMERASTILGVLWSGMGHVFSGEPVRGALYGFLFVIAVVGVVLRAGVVRPPFEGVPIVVRVVPLVILFLLVYPLSLLRLRRKS